MGNFTEFVFLCHQICDFIHSATLGWTEEQKVPFATYGSAWVGYDDMLSYSHKVKHYDLSFKQCSQPQPRSSPHMELAIKLQNCCGGAVGGVDDSQQPWRCSRLDSGHGWLQWILLLGWILSSHQPPQSVDGWILSALFKTIPLTLEAFILSLTNSLINRSSRFCIHRLKGKV